MKLDMGRSLLGVVLGVLCFTPISAQEIVAAPAAVESADVIQSLTTPQFTRLTPGGSLLGTISRPARDGSLRSVPNLEVSLITAGRIVSRVLTNPDGDFAFPQVVPGYYTIVASNPKDLLVFPITVAASDGSDIEPTLLVTATPIAPNRRQAMLAATLGMPGMMSPISGSGLMPVPDSRQTTDTYEISINAAGELRGRLGVLGRPYSQVDMSTMIVRVMREDSVLGEGPVAADGNFMITGVSPGPAAFFAFGPQGFVAIGINLVGGGDISAVAPQGTESFVSLQAGAANLNIEISPIGDVVAGVNIPGDSFSGPTGGALGLPPAGAGGFGGPGGGGGSFGGGGGGSGGAGGLMGLGAAALAAAALGDDGGDSNFIPAPASPAQIP